MRKRLLKIVRDDGGQAMTEFVLIAPVVFFMFFMMIQALMIMNAYHCLKYAAFCAARSLAVHLPHNPDDAPRYAKNAAAIAMAPVSAPVKNEIIHYSLFRSPINSDQAMKLYLQGTPGYSKAFLDSMAHLYHDALDKEPDALDESTGGTAAERLYIAWNRLTYYPNQPNTPTFYWRRPVLGEVEEVFVLLAYDYPLYVPGFGGLWDFLSGDKINETFIQKSILIPYGFLRLRAKCAVGVEAFTTELASEGFDTSNPYEETLEGVDGEKLAELQAELEELEKEAVALEKKKQECTSNWEEEDFDSVFQCRSHYQGKINDIKNQVDDLRDEIEDAAGGLIDF
ncbi:MAG: pilus assembly protein [Verrucomicrobia bacterium]|nr:pilus assembly protein [Verrucomicrobiota bacterium]MDA1088552.1 pilus assembly protein [Verrucomicrobiota bacterium]